MSSFQKGFPWQFSEAYCYLVVVDQILSELAQHERIFIFDICWQILIKRYEICRMLVSNSWPIIQSPPTLPWYQPWPQRCAWCLCLQCFFERCIPRIESIIKICGITTESFLHSLLYNLYLWFFSYWTHVKTPNQKLHKYSVHVGINLWNVVGSRIRNKCLKCHEVFRIIVFFKSN